MLTLEIITLLAVWLTTGWIAWRTNERLEQMPTLNELEGLLAPIVEGLEVTGKQLDKAKTEIIAALGGPAQIPVGALEKLQQLSTLALALKGASQALDDLNPDAPEATPETPAPA